MRGRKPKPTALKLLQGNPGGRAVNADEPAPTTAISLDPPASLEGDARDEWTRVAPMLHRNGLLTECDLDSLTLYCVLYARWREAEKQLRTFGLIIKAKSGYPILSPFLSISNEASRQCQKLLSEFGLTPTSRSRVTVAKKTSIDKVRERFFGQGA